MGFEFNTTSTSAYPYHLLELDSKTIHSHKTFDIPHLRKIKTIPTAVTLPKAITRGILTVREHYIKMKAKSLCTKEEELNFYLNNKMVL